MKIKLCLIVLIFFSCQYKQVGQNIKGHDIIMFTLNEKESTHNISFLFNLINEIIQVDNDYVLIKQKWLGYGSKYISKEYTFAKDKDTMNIECRCGQEINYYFKNLVFRSGNYKLTFQRPKNQILGNEIPTSNKLQNTLFENVYVPQETRNFFLSSK